MKLLCVVRRELLVWPLLPWHPAWLSVTFIFSVLYCHQRLLTTPINSELTLTGLCSLEDLEEPLQPLPWSLGTLALEMLVL